MANMRAFFVFIVLLISIAISSDVDGEPAVETQETVDDTSSLQQEIDEIRQRMQELETEFSQLEDVTRAQTNQIQRLSTDKDAASESNNDLQQKIQSKDAVIRNKDDFIASLQRKIHLHELNKKKNAHVFYTLCGLCVLLTILLIIIAIKIMVDRNYKVKQRLDIINSGNDLETNVAVDIVHPHLRSMSKTKGNEKIESALPITPNKDVDSSTCTFSMDGFGGQAMLHSAVYQLSAKK